MICATCEGSGTVVVGHDTPEPGHPVPVTGPCPDCEGPAVVCPDCEGNPNPWMVLLHAVCYRCHDAGAISTPTGGPWA